MLKKISFCTMLFALCPLLLLAQDFGARYLIITHDTYYNILQPLAQWKTQKGLITKIVKTSDIGSDSTQIRNFIVNAYNTWQIRPEYLLLVGDKYQIPFPRIIQHTYICNSDNYYTNITGDFKNEIIPGRLWVSDTLEAKTVVAKILRYEREPYMLDSLWFRKGVTIVCEDLDSTTSDSVYWDDVRYMHSLMIDAGFVQIDSFSKVFGHDTLDLLGAINNGRSYILYRGVGGGSWGWPFHLYKPDSMKNNYKLPIVISGTCSTIDGIGRLWLGAGTPDNPKGTVGFFGTTTALMGADSLRSALVKGTLNSIFNDSLTTLGKAAEAGRIRYFELFNDSLEYDSWNCLGDPSMELWPSNNKRFSVTHQAMLPIGQCTLNVNVQYNSIPIEDALVSMRAKEDSTLCQTGRTDIFGDIAFIDTSHILGDSVFVSVHKTTFFPYVGIARVPFYGAYLKLQSFAILDTSGGNGDLIANPGEDIEVPVCLMNWGDSIAYDVFGTINRQTADPFFSLSDTIKYFGNINPLDSAKTTDDGYNAMISPQCPDSHEIDLILSIKDNNDSLWTSEFSFCVRAPILELSDHYFTDHFACLNPGDTNQFFVELYNSGSVNAENVMGYIHCNDSFITIINSSASFGMIPPNTSRTNNTDPFIIAASSITPIGYETDLMLITTSGVIVDTFECTIYVGQKDYLVLCLDPNHTSGPVIKSCLDTLNFNGDYTQILPQGLLSLYKSIFICLGIYPDNYVIKDTSIFGDEIKNYLTDQQGRVYLEGGDTWFADPHNFQGCHLYPFFNIVPIGNSAGQISHFTGQESTFTQAMSFIYSGENNSIDRIDPDMIGVCIFKNTANGLGCGVAANNKSVGVSFELSGLDDSIPPSTKLTLVDSIMKYFGILPTGIVESKTSPQQVVKSIKLHPNPSRQKVFMEFHGFSGEEINLMIYDITGRLVKDLRIALDVSPGAHITWDGTDKNGVILPNGVYFLKFEAENFVDIKKCILLR